MSILSDIDYYNIMINTAVYKSKSDNIHLLLATGGCMDC